MPIGEIELHPYLLVGAIKKAQSLILGSFPVYESTNPDNAVKLAQRNMEGTLRFFYGSDRNCLWTLYKQSVDPTIGLPLNTDEIITSLNNKRIALSDIILSCERYIYKTDKKTGKKNIYPYSSEDTALHVRQWNDNLIREIIAERCTKILCTSKMVLENLERRIICNKGFGNISANKAISFQRNLIAKLGGNSAQIKGDIVKVFTVGNAQVTPIAIPSPRSPNVSLPNLVLKLATGAVMRTIIIKKHSNG